MHKTTISHRNIVKDCTKQLQNQLKNMLSTVSLPCIRGSNNKSKFVKFTKSAIKCSQVLQWMLHNVRRLKAAVAVDTCKQLSAFFLSDYKKKSILH